MSARAEATDIDSLVRLFEGARHELSIFMDVVWGFIGQHPELTRPGAEVVHTCRKRLKDPARLAEKVARKRAEGRSINVDNFFSEITDLAGVRVLHLFQEQFRQIDNVIRQRVDEGDWILAERPLAYTWDPENVLFFEQFDLAVNEKSSFYTSVHYLIKPRIDSRICCELQVRTLFEEIWGEVDHRINYPTPTDNLASREQIRVLSKVVGAGSRLLDALHRVHYGE